MKFINRVYLYVDYIRLIIGFFELEDVLGFLEGFYVWELVVFEFCILFRFLG